MTALDMEHEVSSIEVFHDEKEVFLENETINDNKGWGRVSQK